MRSRNKWARVLLLNHRSQRSICNAECSKQHRLAAAGDCLHGPETGIFALVTQQVCIRTAMPIASN